MVVEICSRKLRRPLHPGLLCVDPERMGHVLCATILGYRSGTKGTGGLPDIARGAPGKVVMRNRPEGYFLKSYIPIAILIVSVSLASCLRTPTPDDNLASGILLGDITAVQQALDHGANVNRQYQDGTTPLMYACREFKHHHAEAGADVEVGVKVDFDNSRASAGIQARNAHASRSSQTVKGNRAVVELLIARGADVHAKGKEGQTALSLAIRNNLSDIAEILRKAGAME